MTVGELKRALQGVADELPVLIDEVWARSASPSETDRPLRLNPDDEVAPVGTPVFQISSSI